jgi:glycosyltransferase involved in cell wall biosynthesis
VIHVLPHARTLGGTERAVLDLLESPELEDVCQRVVFVQPGAHVGLPSRRLLGHPSRPWQPLRAIHTIARLRPRVIHGWLLQGNLIGAVAQGVTPNSRLIASERNVGDTLNGAKRLLERIVAARESVVTANSRAVRAAVLRRLPGRAESMRLLPPGLAPPVRPPRVVETDAVMVGRIDPVKDYQCALRAWARAAKPDGARLTIVGDGSERTTIQRLVRTLEVHDTVTLAGDVDPRPYLFGARLFVQSSLAEGFSRALLEALMAGLPAVVTDVGGVRELSAGVVRVVPPGDSAALAQALSLALADPQELLSRARCEARLVAAQFDLGRCCRAYRELYREMGVA